MLHWEGSPKTKGSSEGPSSQIIHSNGKDTDCCWEGWNSHGRRRVVWGRRESRHSPEAWLSTVLCMWTLFCSVEVNNPGQVQVKCMIRELKGWERSILLNH